MRVLNTFFIISFLALTAACVKAPVEEQPKPIEDAHFSMQKGIEAHNQGLYTDAVSWFERALRLNESLDKRSSITKAHLNLAELKMILSQDQQAFEHLKTAQAIMVTDNLPSLLPYLHLLASSYEIRQNNDSDALRLINTYIDEPELDSDLKLAYLANRIKIALNTEPSTLQHWLNRYSAHIGQSDSASSHSMRLKRFKLQAGLLPPEPTVYEEILDYYRAKASRVSIAETLEEWAIQLESNQQNSAAKERLARAAKIRLLMGDNVGSKKLIGRMELL